MPSEEAKKLLCSGCRQPIVDKRGGSIVMQGGDHDPYVWFFCTPCYGNTSLVMGRVASSLVWCHGQEWAQVPEMRDIYLKTRKVGA